MHYAVHGSLPRKHIVSICVSHSGISALRHFVFLAENRYPPWLRYRYSPAPRVRRELYSTVPTTSSRDVVLIKPWQNVEGESNWVSLVCVRQWSYMDRINSTWVMTHDLNLIRGDIVFSRYPSVALTRNSLGLDNRDSTHEDHYSRPPTSLFVSVFLR